MATPQGDQQDSTETGRNRVMIWRTIPGRKADELAA